MNTYDVHYFTFHFSDGTTKEFAQEDDSLSARIRNGKSTWLLVDKEIINLNNVLRVSMDTQRERSDRADERSKQTAESMEAFGKMMR